MPDDPKPAGDKAQPDPKASDVGALAAKLKKVEATNKLLTGQLAEETGKRQTAEQKVQWAETLSGDIPEEVRDTIFKENLSLSQREEAVKQTEADTEKTRMEVETSKIAAEFGLELEALEGCETVEAMRVKALETKNASLSEEIEKAKKAGGGYDFAGNVTSGIMPKDMTEEQFAEHLKQQKDGYYARQVQT